jgi:hypothetical protein
MPSEEGCGIEPLLLADGQREFGGPLRNRLPVPAPTAEIMHEVQVAVHGVLPHVFVDLFVVEESAQFLQAVVAESATTAACRDDDGALQKTVEIDDQVVMPFAQFPEKGPQLPERRCDPATSELLHPETCGGRQ